jgi:hypothetical protein
MIDWPTHKKTRYALCAGETEVLLAEVHLGKKGFCSVRSLSSSSRGQGDEIAVNRLFAGIARKKAQVALILPLSSFEIVSVTVPSVNREAVAKLLPYRLAKILDVPVTDYIYDWQVVQSFPERQELTVYLYPAAMFKKFQQELCRRQVELTWFEADVFSACSYLELSALSQGSGAILCILVWKSSISMAVFEQERITLVRSLDLHFPADPYLDGELAGDTAVGAGHDSGQAALAVEEIVSGSQAETALPPVEAFEQVETENYSIFTDEEDVLAEFSLLQGGQGGPVIESVSEGAARQAEEDGAEGKRGQRQWQGYLQDIILEILRTNDYNVSVLKGKPLDRVFVGGADFFYNGLERVIKGNMSVQVEQFPPRQVDADCDQNLAALCIGALRR